MFTKNWYKCLIGDQWYQKEVTLKYPSGIEIATKPNSSRLYNSAKIIKTTTPVNDSAQGVAFGSGTAKATPDDYTLAGSLFATVTGTWAERFETADGYVQQINTYTLTNTGDTDFTIGEIGLFFSPSGAGYVVLMERTVLDEPVTIPAGGIGQVTYTIRMNYPTA